MTTTTAQLTQHAKTIGNRMQQNVRDTIRIDTRSLAIFRILLGLLVVADILLRSRNFWYFYSGEGVVPQSLALDAGRENAFSFYFFVDDPTLIAGLFVLQVLFAIQLIFGYKTRIATIISFLFVVSLDHHNPFVTSYADILFRLLFFWAIFLPLGERWSIDAVHRDRSPRSSFAGIAALFAMGQMVWMYLVNWFHKSQDSLWTSGEATPLIMGLDDMTFLLAGTVREFPTLLEYGGLLWYYMLLVSPLLILLVGRTRYPLILLFFGGHAMFALTVRIGAFAYVAFAGLVLFLQPQFWSDTAALSRRVGMRTEPFETVRDRCIQLAERVPKRQPQHPSLPALKQYTYSAALGIVIGSIVIYTVFTVVPMGVVGEQVSPEDRIEENARALSIDQPEWSVFAPTPRTTDRYYVFAAETADGALIDVYNDGRELTSERPYDELQNQYGTYRERFYMNSIRRSGMQDRDDSAAVLAAYTCELWAEEHDTELTQLTMYTITESITRETISDPANRESRSWVMFEYSCTDEPPERIALPD
ncbi:HTTM domain-containing protein [Natronocalculus amylovorans]|uniref:HTTM domain-containing protein n=1 Tax=Natronocalculus amylovorans TaxID=2917812 RepID=A0AAE3FX44_9EURY|nr:HTTM domain-containing protein [Natronocalculus amylovorans]MCL9816816.1 HTTM domain-containing protein [Natronocalculus amylovorans]